MTTKDQAQRLLDRLAADVSLEELTLDDSNSVTLQINDDLLVSIGYDESQASLILFSTLAGSAGPLPGALLWQLLEANFLWLKTNGATLALEPDANGVVLQQRLALSDLDDRQFQDGLEAFIHEAGNWTQKISRSFEQPDAGGRFSAQGGGSSSATDETNLGIWV